MSFGVVTSESTRPAVSAEPKQEIEPGPKVSPRVQTALVLLQEAYAYAKELDRDVWDFAVEIEVMHSEGVTNSDFRWMAYKELIEHARETTLAGDEHRSFRRGGSLTFNKRTCFVLTKAGCAFAKNDVDPLSKHVKLATLSAARTGNSAVHLQLPEWDRDRQELRLGNLVVKQFKVPAPNQELILAAFQEERWPVRIDDPLPPHPELDPKRRLHDTINSLNRSQKHPLIRFLGDGSGQGVRWGFAGREADSTGPNL